ncbi:MAG: hypothetical protein KDA47_09940 [Planctomycetales bacterium]|nr:hypothetical protein [Planctomycetales bacterium]
MIDFEYLQTGIQGLANAHKAGTMAGHLGAAVVAGYFLGEDHADWDDAVFAGITGELKRIIAGEEAIWWNVKQTGLTAEALFEPLPDGPANAEAIRTLAEALARNIGETRQSGHNVIFAAIAIRALSDHTDMATPAVLAGVRKLIAGFNGAHAGRGYYGKPTGWKTGNQVRLDAANDFPAYSSVNEMAGVMIDELIATAEIKKQGFGGLWHLVNHTAAILELDRFGYKDLARQGLPAHHYHIRLHRSLPDVGDELGPVVKSTHDPRDPMYWESMLKRDEARLTHRIKTLYGYYVLRRYVEEETKRREADEAFLWLMA